MRTTVERELKLEPENGFTLPALPGVPLEPRLFTSTYYDTPGRSLAGVGITLRRRVENGRSLWQLKLPRTTGARAEIEALGGPAGPPADLRALLVAHLRDGDLEPVATLRTRRAGVRVEEGGRAIADVTLDVVAVLDAGRSTGGFAEVEIELVDGDEADLRRLGKRLRRAGARRFDGRPKLMRVLPAPQGDDATAGRELQSLLAGQLRELLRYDPGVRLGDDPEDLHRFRVATRRARALIRATSPLLGDGLAPLAEELAWLAGMLGAVRDLDVLLERLRSLALELDDDRAAAEAIVSVLEGERAVARDALLAALGSTRYPALLRSFEEALPSLPVPGAPGRLRAIAKDELRKFERATRKLPDDAADVELHSLRIRTKRARYAAELAAFEPGAKRLAPYLDALKRLQDVIGSHQDAVVAEERIRKVARARTALAAGRMIERERARRADSRRACPAAISAVLESARRAF